MTYRLRASHGKRKRDEWRATLTLTNSSDVLKHMYPMGRIDEIRRATMPTEEERNRKRGKRRSGRRVGKGVPWWRHPWSPLTGLVRGELESMLQTLARGLALDVYS